MFAWEADTPQWWGKAKVDLDTAIQGFTKKIAEKLKISPKSIIIRKNPYLFRLRDCNRVEYFAESILNAYLSSSEETLFGDLVEHCAIVLCKHAMGGWKSTAEGIDLEFDKKGINGEDIERFIIQIKSGKNWGNSSQQKKLRENFTKASRVLRQAKSIKNVRCIEGICYGKSERRDVNHHQRIVGAEFWEEITGWPIMYSVLIDVFGEFAQNGLHEEKERAKKDIIDFLKKNGLSKEDNVQWDRLVEFICGK